MSRPTQTAPNRPCPPFHPHHQKHSMTCRQMPSHLATPHQAVTYQETRANSQEGRSRSWQRRRSASSARSQGFSLTESATLTLHHRFATRHTLLLRHLMALVLALPHHHHRPTINRLTLLHCYLASLPQCLSSLPPRRAFPCVFPSLLHATHHLPVPEILPLLLLPNKPQQELGH